LVILTDDTWGLRPRLYAFVRFADCAERYYNLISHNTVRDVIIELLAGQ